MFGMIQAVANAGRTKKANKALKQLLTQDPLYKQNQYAQRQLDTAQQFLNGRMAGASDQERNIFTSLANTVNNVNRNATSGAQALAAGAAAQGQTDQSLADLQMREQQNKYSMLQNLNQAYAGMINEGDKAYNDQVRRFGDTAQIQGQIQQNKTNALNGVFNGLNSDINQAIQLFGMASGGGFGSLLGGGGGGGANGSYQPQSAGLGATVGTPSWNINGGIPSGYGMNQMVVPQLPQYGGKI